MAKTIRNIDVNSLVGTSFGAFVVIDVAPDSPRGAKKVFAQCTCGNIIEEYASRIVDKKWQRCPKCAPKENYQKVIEKYKRYIGTKRDSLTVVDVLPKSDNDSTTVLLCQCDCGKLLKLQPSRFINGITKCCQNCITKAGVRDGRSKRNHKLYTLWAQMLNRCENPKNKHYYRYGGRGIKVCEEWHDYLKFEEWVESAGGKPEGMSLDRIDNDGDYCPENCRLATQREQTRNTNRNINITYNGKTQCLSDWAKETGLTFAALEHRYHRGWDIERMLTTPIQKKLKRITP